MTDSLDQMIAPGERVVWRDPRGWAPRSRWWLLLATGLCLAFAAAIALSSGTAQGRQLSALVLGLGGLGIAVTWLQALRMERGFQAAVTERRLLYRSALKNREPVDLPLAEIAMLGVDEHHDLTVHTRGGAEIPLTGLRRVNDFADALTVAACLPRQSLSGQLVLLDSAAVGLGGFGALFLALLLFTDLLAGPGGEDALVRRLLHGFAVAVPAMWTGMHLARVLGLIAIRRNVTAAEVGAWLCPTHGITASNRASRLLIQLEPLYHHLARQLWDQPLHCQTCMEMRDGL